MTKQIVPLTRSDFENWERKIVKNNDEFCSHCDGELEKHVLKNGIIVYLCYKCDTVWKKEIIDENNFRLVKSKELTII